jgi:hypothetical protein
MVAGWQPRSLAVLMAMGRDYTDPALPVGHEPMGDPPS